MSLTCIEVLDKIANEIKIVVLGDGGVGKSALIIRFISDSFLDEYDPTIEDSYRKQMELDGNPVLYDILDTAGQEEFWSMQDQWMREGESFIIAYPITSQSSFDCCEILIEKIIRTKDKASEQIPIVLVGTKCDLADQRRVSKEEGQQLANKWKIPFYECSAKEKINHHEIFHAACREYIRIKTGGIFERNENYQTNKGIDYVLKGCISLVYLVFCGCIWHGLYLVFKKLYNLGCCKCTECTELCAIWKWRQINSSYARRTTRMREWEEREKRNQLNLLFKRVEYIEEDGVKLPVISLKNFWISRRLSLERFFKALLCGLFLPLVIIFQTFVFLTYSEEKASDGKFYYGCLYTLGYQYDSIHHSLLLDFLGLVVGRHPNQDPDAIKTRNWFLQQTKTQKLHRIMITIFLCLTFLIIFHNISEVNNERLRVSLMETVGPFLLFWIEWFLLSSWIAYESKLKPKMPNTYRLRSIKLYLGEEYTHMTDAHKFLRAYAWTRNKKWKLPKFRTLVIIFLGLLYACIPGLTRLLIGDPSDGLKRKKFITKREWTVETGALLVNFILVSSFIYAIEVQYSKHFDNYREWMFDLTHLLNKTNRNKQIDSNQDEDEHYIPQKGRNFSKDIFLSLTRKSNGLGWLEIRSFLAAEGKLLFAQQEIPTLWILGLTIALSIYLVCRVFLYHDNPLQSVLFNGATMLSAICLVSLIRIAITGYRFEAIQHEQERLLGEQRFFMRCGVDNIDGQQSQRKLIKHVTVPLSTVNFQFSSKSDDENDAAQQMKMRTTIENGTNEETESKQPMEDQPNKELVNYIAAELQLAQTNKSKEEETDIIGDTTADIDGEEKQVDVQSEDVKVNINEQEVEEEENEEDEEEEEEVKPLLGPKGVNKRDNNTLNRVQKDISNISDIIKSDKFGFIDNMLFIVQKKDIYPRLFNVKLNSVLAKAIATILVSGIAAAVKILL